jgi:beta-glucanase (GH16 family)
MLFLAWYAIFHTAQITKAESRTVNDAYGSWKLTWKDEFNVPDKTPLDASKWVMETGGGGWGNNELQYYTARRENVFIEGGTLVIKALKETYTGADGVTRDYTSARLKTQGKFAQKFGRFEARINLPYSQGIWPAFWMLGDDIKEKGWPTCGEIDIMEHIGREPTKAFGTLHGPGYSGAEGLSSFFTLPKNKRFADDFHTFAIEWEPRVIRWFVDGNLYATKKPADLPSGKRWVYDHPFFMLLNVAVGGNWPGNPDAASHFPQTMRVDYVRVYQRKS